jgi:hypothetical protein
MYEDIYDDEFLEELSNEDAITAKEAGIMHWYDVEVEKTSEDYLFAEDEFQEHLTL